MAAVPPTFCLILQQKVGGGGQGRKSIGYFYIKKFIFLYIK